MRRAYHSDRCMVCVDVLLPDSRRGRRVGSLRVRMWDRVRGRCRVPRRCALVCRRWHWLRFQLVCVRRRDHRERDAGVRREGSLCVLRVGLLGVRMMLHACAHARNVLYNPWIFPSKFDLFLYVYHHLADLNCFSAPILEEGDE
jgi:hypothetical protein